MSQELLDIADRYDRELDGLTKEALDRIFSAYDTSYRTLIDRLRTSYPRLVEAGSISTLVRQGAIAAELGEALKFIRPENEAAYQQLGEQVIEAAMSQGSSMAGDTLQYLGVSAPFTTIPIGAVRNQAEKFKERLVNYSEVQASSISATVELALTQGWGTRKTESALKGLGISFKSNAETVSRTETLSAFNGAARSRNEQAGLAYAMFVAAPSERMCSLCGERNGKVYAAKDLPAIPVHPRCRCTSIFYPSLSDIDQEFWAKYRQEGLDDLAAKGLRADGGLTYWEKKAGLTEAPKAVWVPGDKLPEVAKAAKTPRPKETVPDSVHQVNKPHYQAAIDGKLFKVSKDEIEDLEFFTLGADPEKVDRVIAAHPKITKAEAKSLAMYIGDGYADMSKRFYAPTAKIDPFPEPYTAKDVDTANKLFGNALRKMPAITEASINKNAREYAAREGHSAALYDPQRGLTRGIRLSGADLDALVKQHQDALSGSGLIRQNTLFATTTLPIEDVAIAADSNVIYRVKPRLDGQGQGRYIDHFKNTTVEGEVMYPAFSQFRVTGVRQVAPAIGSPPSEADLNLAKIAQEVTEAKAEYGENWEFLWSGKVPSKKQLAQAQEAERRVNAYRPPQFEIDLEEP
jgi:SPP1 gp7 family putative phage head morphogenesis protein